MRAAFQSERKMEEKARARIEDNIKLVYFIYGRLAQSELFFRYRDDLISDGFFGLVKAAQKFDDSRGVKFASFATACIRNQIFMGLRKLRKQTAHETSLDAPIGVDEDGHELYWLDVLEAPQPQLVEERLDFHAFMKTASEKERHIVQAKRLGYTQKEIGRQLNLSQSYVARLYKKFCLRFREQENAV